MAADGKSEVCALEQGGLQLTGLEEARLFIRYRPEQTKTALFLLIGFSPIWAVWLPWLCCSMMSGAWLSDIVTVLSVVSFWLIVLGSAILTLICLDNKIELTPDAMHLPLHFLLNVGWPLTRQWHKLRQVQLKDESGGPGCASSLVFIFDQGERLHLSLFGLDKLNFELLIRYMHKFASHIEIDVKDLGSDFNLNESRVLRSNFTQIWQSGLVNKFNATAFVPLESGCELNGGRLKIMEQLSFGGLTAAYSADLNGQGVIVKELAVAPSDDLSYFKAKELFEREADLLMNIDHPRIAKLRDFFVENSRHYLVLSYIKGVDLRERINQGGAVSEEVALEWCAQVAETLSFLHECIPCVVHRDITPDNLVLRSDNSICIIDFGAASQFLSSATGTIIGKQSYVSPEQFRGKAVPVSDLYSLAATLYFLLCGQDPEPLTPASPAGIVDISEGTSSFIISSMSLDPKERPGSAREFAKKARALVAPPLIAS